MTGPTKPRPSGILRSRYTMEADVYAQERRREESGQVRSYWTFDRTIDLIARPILGGGIRVVGSIERWDDEYMPIDWIKFQTDVELSKRYRIHDIRDKRTGRHLWEDNERNADVWTPMMFDIVGVMPIADPFGRLLEYDSLAKKVQNLEEGNIVWK